MILLLVGFLFIALTTSVLSKLLSSSQNAPLPPGPKPLPIIGNLLEFDDQPHISLARLAKFYGPIISVKLGFATAVVVSSPEMAREVLQRKDAFFSSRLIPDSMRAHNYQDESIFFLPSTSPIWKHHRAICAINLFSARNLDTTREIRAQKIYDTINVFHRKAGHPTHIGEIIFAGTLNIISNALYSQDVVNINSESPQEMKELTKKSTNQDIEPNISDFFPFLRFLDLQSRRQTAMDYTKRFCKYFDVIIDTRLEHRKNGGKCYGDLLDTLLDLFAESKVTRREIQALLRELLEAGSDTSSVTVQWAMCELLRDPVAMARAQAEVRDAFASQTLTESDMLNLLYLQAVIKEAMRLHPAGPLLPHKAIDDGLDLGGYRVPKGVPVFVNTWAIGRDPQVWNEPNAFRPERFFEKQVSFQGRDFEFLPFSSGKRSCPGLHMGVRMVSYLLALMLAKFDWKLPDGMMHKDVDVKEKFAAVLELAVPLCLVPVPVINNQLRDVLLRNKVTAFAYIMTPLISCHKVFESTIEVRII